MVWESSQAHLIFVACLSCPFQGFLEEVDFAIDRADREFKQQGGSLKLYQKGAAQRRQALLDACAAPDRRTRLLLAPAALELGRSNTSRVVFAAGTGRTDSMAFYYKGAIGSIHLNNINPKSCKFRTLPR